MGRDQDARTWRPEERASMFLTLAKALAQEGIIDTTFLAPHLFTMNWKQIFISSVYGHRHLLSFGKCLVDIN